MILLAALAIAQNLYEPGITFRMYDTGVAMEELYPLVAGQSPNIDVLVKEIDFKDGTFPSGELGSLTNHFVAEGLGEIEAKTSGDYAFRLTSDDGSELYIDDKMVISNDGVHPAVAQEGTVKLTPGWHKFKIRYFESEGGEVLKWEWKPVGATSFSKVTSENTRVPKGITRVVSGGTKSIFRPGGPLRPGAGMPLDRLHPGLDLMTIRPDGFEPQVGGMAFLPDGRLLICTFHPNQAGQFLPNVRDGGLYLLSGVQGNDRSKIKVKKIAENLKDPLGLCVVGKDIYVSQQFEITRLRDTNGDDIIDEYKTVANGWTSNNYHHFTFGLLYKDGWLYGSLSTSITGGAPGINGPNPENRGTTFRVNPDKYDPKNPKANIEFLSGGHRTPNGLGWGPEGTLLVGENQGAWQPANKINVVYKGHFYGHYNNTTFKTPEYPNGGLPGPYDKQPLTQPGIYIPHNECGNSPSQMTLLPSGRFKGQLLVTDVKYGGLSRGWLEKVKGQWQGGIVHFSHGFECGTNRLAWGPDGGLYIGMIGANETWGWVDPKLGHETYWGLQRVKFNGKNVLEFQGVKVVPGGFEATFTKPVDPKSITKDKWYAKQWNYKPTPDYGGNKFNQEVLTVKSVKLSADGLKATVMVADLKEDRVVYLRTNAETSAGEKMWSSECWYTLNKKP